MKRTAFAISVQAIVAIAPSLAYSQTLAVELPTKGNISYQGTYDGNAQSGTRNVRTQETAGALTIRMSLDGPAATAEIRPTGNMTMFKASGTRIGQRCKLFTQGGDLFEGECTSAYFNGALTSPNSTNKYRFNVRFTTKVLEVVDDAESQRKAGANKAADEQVRANVVQVSAQGWNSSTIVSAKQISKDSKTYKNCPTGCNLEEEGIPLNEVVGRDAYFSREASPYYHPSRANWITVNIKGINPVNSCEVNTWDYFTGVEKMMDIRALYSAGAVVQFVESPSLWKIRSRYGDSFLSCSAERAARNKGAPRLRNPCPFGCDLQQEGIPITELVGKDIFARTNTGAWVKIKVIKAADKSIDRFLFHDYRTGASGWNDRGNFFSEAAKNQFDSNPNLWIKREREANRRAEINKAIGDFFMGTPSKGADKSTCYYPRTLEGKYADEPVCP
ncbi:hypothetical protein [Roseateles sp. P5_E8]